MKLRTQVTNLYRLSLRIYFNFSKNQQPTPPPPPSQPIIPKSQNRILKFIKDGWKETFPKEQDQIKRKYQKVKQIKRYTEQELKKMQEEIPEYQRTALVETQQKIQENRAGFKVVNIIPESVRKKLSQTDTYKQYSQFKQNFKQFVNTSDSVAVNLGTKAFKMVSQPSSSSKATVMMRQYEKDFSLIQLQRQSTFIFRDLYHLYLRNDIAGLEKMCGEQALDLLRSLIKINEVKKVRPKYGEMLDYKNSRLSKTIVSQNSLPSFIFEINIMEIYCMIDAEGKIVDGDDERVVSSTYQFLIKYSGQYVAELGHPWQVTEFRKIGEIKYLV